jgi:hypothetical protein
LVWATATPPAASPRTRCGRRARSDQFETAEALDHLARIAFARSALRDAETYTRDGLAIARRLGTPRQVWLALQRLGHIARREGDWQRAVVLFSVAAAIRAATGEVQSDGAQQEIDGYLDALRGERGVAVLAAVWARGAALSHDAAIDYALTGAGAA